MRKNGLAALLASMAAVALGGCGTTNIGAPAGRAVRAAPAQQDTAPVEVTLIAFNDFHGNLELPRRAITAADANGSEVRVPAGGAAYLASAIDAVRARSPNHLVLSAGDLISASPLVSSLFLDEPTVQAMNLIRLDFNAVGNHEFDRGRAELLRLDRGGCEKNTNRQPCAVDPNFGGADFGFLAANVITETGAPLLPAYAIRRFGSGASAVDVAVIGMTLKETPSVVTPEGVAGLTFQDEAETVNALMPRLKAEGADVVVVLIHQGLDVSKEYQGTGCGGLSGDLMPVLQRLSPEVDFVISGHTHQTYICDFAELDPQRRFLVTSGGVYGTMLTEIRMRVDPRTGELVSRTAENRIVQSEAFTTSSGEVSTTESQPRYQPDEKVAALVARYRAAAEPQAKRVIGTMRSFTLPEGGPSHRDVIGQLIADAQLAATRASGAQIALMNAGGVRADLEPAGGRVTFGDIFAVQPFGNSMVVRSFTGRQIKAILEQQFASGSNSVEKPNVLHPSAGFTFSYDLERPEGQRIINPRLHGEALQDDRSYRVAFNSFLASGGDNFTLLRDGTNQTGGRQDLDVLEAYFAANPNVAPPTVPRVTNATAR